MFRKNHTNIRHDYKTDFRLSPKWCIIDLAATLCYTKRQEKLTGFWTLCWRAQFLSGLIGKIYLLIRLSISGGAMPLRKSKHIFIAREKFTWYTCLRFIRFTGTCKIIMEQKLYKISRLQSSNVTNSVFLECKLVAPMVCFKSRKDVSMPQRRW